MINVTITFGHLVFLYIIILAKYKITICKYIPFICTRQRDQHCFYTYIPCPQVFAVIPLFAASLYVRKLNCNRFISTLEN